MLNIRFHEQMLVESFSMKVFFNIAEGEKPPPPTPHFPFDISKYIKPKNKQEEIAFSPQLNPNMNLFTLTIYPVFA